MGSVQVAIPPDLELFLTRYLRERAESENIIIEVSNKEPRELETPLTKPLVIVRDDGGSQLSAVSYQRSIGVNVLAGTAQNDAPAKTLAMTVYRWLTDDVGLYLWHESPIAGISYETCTGFTAVSDSMNITRMYGVFQYNAVGSWHTVF